MPQLKLDTQSFLAIFLVVSFVALLFTIVFIGHVPNDDTFKVLAGALSAVGFASVIGFYFGSSSGSKAKDDTMQNVVTNLTKNGDTNVHPTNPAS